MDFVDPGQACASENEPLSRTLPIVLPAALSMAATAMPILVFPETVSVPRYPGWSA
jgi:hypothetical protein